VAGIKFWGHGTTVSFNSVAVGGIESLEGPEESTDKVETTDTASAGSEESVPGLTRPGPFTINCRRIVGDSGQGELMDASQNKTVAEVVITYPPSATNDSTVATDTFDAWVTNISRSTPAVAGEPATISFTLENTGSITEAVA
jgi:hypothetical protein